MSLHAPSLPGAGVALRLGARRPGLAGVAIGALVLVLAFVTLYPIVAVLINGLLVRQPDGSVVIGMSAWASALRQPGIGEAVINTFKVVAVVQGVSFPIAILLAWLLARTNLPGSRWLEFGFWASFLLPTLGTTTGWLLFFSPSYGFVNQMLVRSGLFSAPPFDMFSFWGIVFAHLATSSISIKVMLLTPAFRNLDASIEEASWICGAGRLGTLARVVVPALTPILLVSLLMSIIKAFEAFEIELVLGARIDFSVYSTKIYQLLRASPPDYGSATVLATIFLLLLVPLILLQRWVSRDRSYVTVTGKQRNTPLDLGRWRWPAFAAVSLLVLFLTVAPLLLQVAGSLMTLFGFFDVPQLWTARHWERVLASTDFRRALANSLAIGTGAALAAFFGYALIAYCSARTQHAWRGALDFLSWLPFAVPGILLGLGYLWMVLQVPPLRPLYGTLGVLILVSWLSSITLGVQVIRSNMVQLGSELEEAGRVSGGSWARIFWDVVVRLTTPAIAVVAVIVFATTIRQVGSLVLLSTGATTPLALLQLQYLSDSELGPAAVTGTVVVGLSLAAALVARLAIARLPTQGSDLPAQ